MPIKCLLIFGPRGDVLLTRSFRGSYDRALAEQIRSHILSGKIEAPLFTIDSSILCHKRVHSLHFLALIDQSTNTMTTLAFLDAMVKAMQAFIKTDTLAAGLAAVVGEAPPSSSSHLQVHHIRERSVLILELLDEMLDYGVPQTTDPEVLRLFIQEGTRHKPITAQQQQEVTVQATGAVSHRRPGIKYSSNEVFIDVVERVNLLVSATGTVLRSDSAGQIKVRSRLSGMPECMFGLNERVVGREGSSVTSGKGKGRNIELDDVGFHSCVQLGKFAADRTITFIPPDGEFELMRYRVTEHVSPPFTVSPITTVRGRNLLELRLSITANYPANVTGQKVIVRVPAPPNTASADCTCSLGKGRLGKDGKAVEWRLRLVPGAMTQTCTIKIRTLTGVEEFDMRTWKRPPIEMEFLIPMWTASGLEVRFMNVISRDYKPMKWLRYDTMAGSISIRY
eukprot:gnl/Dysnectes_brevis/3460_a4385_677.p1 GENE.gnl/Dysnectes_brevis/3460_a4385_677~~gnl/Dysnectes_brevis/3460_a4385_677.p1  ORF type:complete len:451 (+),score=148.31 gnl/Dysnectes_brevis/3460_a4385_677:26-1378(+)